MDNTTDRRYSMDNFDYRKEVEEPLKRLPPQEVAYYHGFMDSIIYNIEPGRHHFRIPMEEVFGFQGSPFYFNYYHFCLVVMQADSESRNLYFKPYFKDIGTLRYLYIEIYHTEDDEGIPEHARGGDFNNWDLSIAKKIQAEVYDIRRRQAARLLRKGSK